MKVFSTLVITTFLVTCAGGASIRKIDLNDPGNPRKLQGAGDVTALTDAIFIFLGLKKPANDSDDTSDATAEIKRLHAFHNQTVINSGLAVFKKIKANHTSNGVSSETSSALVYGGKDYSATGFAHSDFDSIEKLLAGMGGTVDDAVGLVSSATRMMGFWDFLSCIGSAAGTAVCYGTSEFTAETDLPGCVAATVATSGTCGSAFR